ncbi:MAG TPA: porin [Pirellulales bacterium]|jgi:hypothetical protein|nr:porin [Pirellulales bacterium]
MQAAPSPVRRYFADYDGGFTISPVDPRRNPFELKVNFQDQLRSTVFSRAVSTWTDSAGNVNLVGNQHNFELPRGRLIVSGFALTPNLIYNLNIDYNTVNSSQINFRAYWLGYRFGRGLTVYLGQDKVPGSREWLGSSTNTLGPDRSMATTFFRPSLSQGIWVSGQVGDAFSYRAMASNGFDTYQITPQELSTKFCYSASLWWEPGGAFGAAYSDLEWHDQLAVRLGGCLTYDPVRGQQSDPNAPENTSVRLSDGTPINETGAIAPGLTIQNYDITLGTIDLGFKRRGLSATGEIYLMGLSSLRGSGPLGVSSIFNYGGFGQVGYFLLPRRCEIYSRTSVVTGPNGTGTEYAGGLNWFFLPGKQNLRFTFDAGWLRHCPADQNRTDYQAGQTGLLVRSQLQAVF